MRLLYTVCNSLFQAYLDKIMKSRDMEAFCRLHEGDFLFPSISIVFAIITCIPWKQGAPIKHFRFQGKVFSIVSILKLQFP